MTDDNTAKLAELLKKFRIAVLTTVDSDGTLISRPMAVQEAEFDGDLWFLPSAIRVRSSSCTPIRRPALRCPPTTPGFPSRARPRGSRQREGPRTVEQCSRGLVPGWSG